MDVISERFRETVIAARHRNYLPQVSPRETSPQHPLSSPESYVTASESMDQSGIQTNDSLPRTGGRSAEYFDPLALRNSPAAQSIPHVPMAHPHRESASSSESSYLNAYVKIDEQLHRDHATTSDVSSTTTQEASVWHKQFMLLPRILTCRFSSHQKPDGSKSDCKTLHCSKCSAGAILERYVSLCSLS